MTRSGKKPGRGYTRTEWIEHHQAIARRGKEREERETKTTESNKKYQQGKSCRDKQSAIEIKESSANKSENRKTDITRTGLTNSLQTWLQNKTVQEISGNKNQSTSSIEVRTTGTQPDVEMKDTGDNYEKKKRGKTAYKYNDEK